MNESTNTPSTSYHRQKRKYEAKINELTYDIVTLLEDKDFAKIGAIKAKWRNQLSEQKMSLVRFNGYIVKQ